MKSKFFLLFLFGLHTMLCAANNLAMQGAAATGIAGIGVVHISLFSSYNNQAALGFLENPQLAFSYENRYFSEQLNVGSVIFAFPINNVGVAAFDIASFGYSQYRETRIGSSFGKQLSNRIAIGTRVDYHLVQVANYGSTSSITADLGIIAEPLDNLWVGAHIFNFTYSKYFSNLYDERLPVVFDLGIAYGVTPLAKVFAATQLSSRHNPNVRFGIEMTIQQVLKLRLGVSAKPVEFFAGFGYTYRNLTLEMAFERHESLGYSPQISLLYCFKTNKKRD
ncbi:MAG: hypothetical protein ACRC3G_09125 [Bacteroidales bacterium]